MCDFEPQRYVELVRNIRAAVGADVDIRVDPHASWGEAQALRFMREVEDYHPEWIEEPVGGRFAHIFRAGHRLRLLSTIPISSHAWLPPLVPHPSTKGRYGDDALDAAVGSRRTAPLATGRHFRSRRLRRATGAQALLRLGALYGYGNRHAQRL